MPQNREHLISHMEEIFFVIPQVHQKVEHLDIPGIRGRITPYSHPFLNIVGESPESTSLEEDTVREVCRIFRREKKSLSWLISEHSSTNARQAIQRHNFSPMVEMSGMIHTTLNIPTPQNNLQVVEVGLQNARKWCNLYAEAYSEPLDVIDFISELLYFNPKPTYRFRNYMVLDGEEPISVATMMYFPNSSAIYLSGAATLQQHRGKGAYTALVHRRLMDAKNDGRDTAIITAAQDTSAPIINKLGFTEICRQTLFVFNPEEAPESCTGCNTTPHFP